MLVLEQPRAAQLGMQHLERDRAAQRIDGVPHVRRAARTDALERLYACHRR
jgi:hypothetical protein